MKEVCMGHLWDYIWLLVSFVLAVALLLDKYLG